MTPVFCCGSECGVNAAHWTLVGSTSFGTGTVRSGTRSLNINTTGTESTATSTIVFAASNKNVARFYVRFATLPDLSGPFFLFSFTGGATAGAFFYQPDSKIVAYGSATSFGASGITITTGQWYRIDVKVDSSANPWLIDVQVDGVACGQKSDAQASSTAVSAALLYIGAGTTANLFFDDLVISQTAADYPIGAGYVNHFVPTSDGTHNVAGAADFKKGAAGVDITNATTDSYLLVDDVPLDAVGSAPTANDYINAIAPPNATDYTENVFGPASGISTPTAAPRAVEVVVETAQASTATGSFKLNLNDNGTVDTIKEQVGVAGVVATKAWTKHYATAPTGGAWTISGAGNFNNLRIRFYSADAAPDQYFVAAMIEAEFAEVVGGAATDLDPMGAMGFFGL